MGVSDLSRYDALLNGIMTQQAQLQQLAIEQTTGTTLQKPSDDPNGTDQLLGISLNLTGISAFQKNGTLVQTTMNTEDSVETALQQLLSSAQSIAQSAASADPGTTTRTQVISQLNQILQQVVSLANTQVGDTYIFSGYKSSTPTIQSTGSAAPTVMGASFDSTEATASVAPTATAGVYQLTSDGAGNVTLTNQSNPSQTETVTGVTGGTPSINFATLGVTVTAGSAFTVGGLNDQTVAVTTGLAYMGDTNRPQVAVDTGVTLPTNHTGDQVFANSIASLQGTIAALTTGSSRDVTTATTQMTQAENGVALTQSDGGVTLQRLAGITAAQTQQQSALESQQSNIDAISPDQVAMQLLSVQNALEEAYAATGRISTLSLTNYLPSA